MNSIPESASSVLLAEFRRVDAGAPAGVRAGALLSAHDGVGGGDGGLLRAPYGHAVVVDVGSDRHGLERHVSAVQPGAVRRSEAGELSVWRDAAACGRGGVLCDRDGWDADSAQQPSYAGDERGCSAPRTPVFGRGIHRAQRFVHGCWFTSMENGYSRAIPLRFLPAFPEKAVKAAAASCKEWEAAVDFVRWVRRAMDEVRPGQRILWLADGSYDTVELWKAVPERVVAAIRTATNRVLYAYLPPAERRGRRKYGERMPTPDEWMQQWRKGTHSRRRPGARRDAAAALSHRRPRCAQRRAGCAALPGCGQRPESIRKARCASVSKQRRADRLPGLGPVAGRTMGVASGSCPVAGLALATVGDGGRPSRNEEQSGCGRTTMLERPFRHRLGTVERLGLRRAGLGWLSNLASLFRSGPCRRLVATTSSLVFQHLVACLPGRTLEPTPVSSHLDPNPANWPDSTDRINLLWNSLGGAARA